MNQALCSAEKACACVGTLSRALCWMAGLVLLLAMALATCVDIATRPWGAGIPGIWEMVTLAMRVMIGLALPWAFYSGSHVAVEAFTDALPARLRQLTIVLALTLSLLAVILLAWKITDRLIDIRSYGGVTPDLGLPSYVDWIPLAAGPMLSVPVLLAMLWREGLRLFFPQLEQKGQAHKGQEREQAR